MCVFLCKQGFWLLSAAYLSMWLTLGKELLLEELFSQSRKAMAWGIVGSGLVESQPVLFSGRILTVNGFSWNSFIIVEPIFLDKKSSTVKFFDQFNILVQHLGCITPNLSSNSLTAFLINVYLNTSLWAVSLIIMNAKFQREFHLSLDRLQLILGRFSIWKNYAEKRFLYWKTNLYLLLCIDWQAQNWRG